MRFLLILLAVLPCSAAAEEVLLTHLPQRRLVLVARGHAGTIEFHDDRSGARAWSADGVTTPRLSAISEDGRLAAVADAVANQVVVVSVTDRSSRIHTVPETPVAMTFIADSLFVLSRDGAALTRIRRGESQPVSTMEHPTHLARSEETLLIYSSTSGTIAQYDPHRLAMTRRASIAPFASDLAADSRRAYLVYPRKGKMASVRLADFRLEEEFAAGAVPVDLDLASDPNLITAGTISVADPSSKRIWNVERSQSQAEAFGRGFMRGLLGLGLYSPRSSEFPTGIDRIWSVGRRRFAWDSSSGTLYQVVRGRGRPIWRTSSERRFAAAGDRLAVWNDERQTVEFRGLNP